MKPRRGRLTAAGAVALAGSLVALVACEDTTSGIGLTQAGIDIGLGEAGASSSSSSSSSGGETELPACTACALDKCAEELEDCGSQCTDTLLCMLKCEDDLPCQDRCLRRTNNFKGNGFYGCVLAECAESELCDVAFQRAKALTTYALAFCTRYQQCNPGNFTYQYGTIETCAQQNIRYYVWQENTIDADISTTSLQQCATSTLELSCEDFNSERSSWACQPRGPRLEGDECVDDAQCETGFCAENNFRCGQCAIPPTAGQPCVADRCAPGLVCGDGTCLPPTHYAGRCDDTHPCEGRSYCNSAGQCVSQSQTVGDTCGVAGGVVCDFSAGYVCDGGTNQCIQFAVADEGLPCGFRSPGYVYCVGALCPSSGVCPPQRVDGDACDDERGPSCLFPDQCIDGTCQKLPPSNQECE